MALGSALKDFYCGDTVTLVIGNKPYVDLTVPPDLNDYRNAETARVKIYDPAGNLIVDDDLCQVPNRPGWYSYNYRTSCEGCVFGIYKVEVTMESCNVGCGTVATTGCATTGSSGTSGTPDQSVCSDTAVDYFRIMPRGTV